MTKQLKVKSSPKKKPGVISKRKALKYLAEIFLRNGYLRTRDKKKLKMNGAQNYKKGFEIRLVAKNRAELRMIRAAIKAMDLTVSKTFIKHNATIQPIYGKEITLKFKKLKKDQLRLARLRKAK